MKKVLKVFAIAVLLIIAAIGAFIAYRSYKAKTFKDSHDLQDHIASRCNRFIKDGQGAGMAVAVVQGDKTYIVCFGKADRENNRQVDTNTIFEIGSLTKVFTAELTQILVDQGRISWNENICSVLPENFRPDVNDGTTLLALATHTSGFPRRAAELMDKARDKSNPYADIDPVAYRQYIKKSPGKQKPDSTNSSYSNLGFSVLTDCLEAKTGMSYDSLLQNEILGVLHLTHTGLKANEPLHFATGYNEQQHYTSHWDFSQMYGAGALRSTISDMCVFLKANMYDGPLYKPFHETQQKVYHYSILKGGGIGKGWDYNDIVGGLSGAGTIVWKNGGTGGFRSYLGMSPDKKVGLVILSNQASPKFDGLAVELMGDACKISLR